MPFSGSTYSLPSAAFVTHTAIKASPANMDFIDIGAALSLTYTTTLNATILTTTQHSLIYPTNCQLVLSSASVIKLMPYNGNYLWISDRPRLIPAAGVSLTLSGLTAGTLYYVYAQLNVSEAIELVLSTVAPAQRSDNGFFVQFGNNERTLVGAIFSLTSSTTADSTRQRFIASWFNPPVRLLAGNAMAGVSVSESSESLIDPLATVVYVRFAGRPGKLQFEGYANNPVTPGNIYATVGIDNVSNYYDILSVKSNAAGVNVSFSVMAHPFAPGSDLTAVSVAVPVGYSDSGTATYTGSIRGWII